MEIEFEPTLIEMLLALAVPLVDATKVMFVILLMVWSDVNMKSPLPPPICSPLASPLVSQAIVAPVGFSVNWKVRFEFDQAGWPFDTC